MEQSDIALHSSPVFVIHRQLGKNKDGSIIVKSRVVKNFKALNDNTHNHYYDNLTIQNLNDKLAMGVLLNSTDIKK